MDDTGMNWLIIILGVFFSALLGAFIGNARGRPGAGAFWSLFLGPIGWIIILLGPDYRLKCPECGGVIDSGVRRCKHCGVDFIKRQRPVVIQDLSDPIPDNYRPTRVKVPVPSPKNRGVIQMAVIIGLAFLLSMASSVYSADHQFIVTARGQPQQAKKKITGKYGGVNDSLRATDADIAKTLALEIAIRNAAAKPDTCALSWFFIAKSLDSDERRIFDQGTQTCKIEATSATNIVLKSQPVTTSVTAWSDGDVRKRGEKIEGYVLFVKDEDGKLISLKSTNTQLDTIAKDPEKWAALFKTAEDVPNAEK